MQKEEEETPILGVKISFGRHVTIHDIEHLGDAVLDIVQHRTSIVQPGIFQAWSTCCKRLVTENAVDVNSSTIHLISACCNCTKLVL